VALLKKWRVADHSGIAEDLRFWIYDYYNFGFRVLNGVNFKKTKTLNLFSLSCIFLNTDLKGVVGKFIFC